MNPRVSAGRPPLGEHPVGNRSLGNRPGQPPVQREAAVVEPAETPAPAQGHQRPDLRLNVFMALTVCFSGATLAGDPATQSLPIIACLFAMIGLVLVDWLRWFSLPPVAAYLALGGIAVYSINHLAVLFSGEEGGSEMQMVVVAELLVLVQAVLMLQEKNRRIYEQITIFCLLELIVASIFNDALSYGLILIPLGAVALSALALLQTYGLVDEIFWERQRPPRPFLPFQRYRQASEADRRTVTIEVQPQANAQTLLSAGRRLPRVAALLFAPAVLFLAAVFFYGLPRTSSAAGQGRGRAITGFSDKVQLGQIGRMLQSREMAMRVMMWETIDDNPYHIASPIYLRGNVLERYQAHTVRDGSWQQVDMAHLTSTARLPHDLPPRAGAAGADLSVRVVLEPSTSDALFAIAPYRRSITTPEVLHSPDRWLLSRRATPRKHSARLTYQFATDAFRDARQSRFIPRWDDSIPADVTAAPARPAAEQLDANTHQSSQAAQLYLQHCLEWDPQAMPSIPENLQAVLESLPDDFDPDNDLDLAQAIENYFVVQRHFEYSLDEPYSDDIDLDPIECFLSQTRRGNCQYFASAMVMMLRARGIPARLVVGYHTDEYNPLGDYYAVRQLHAHAWVEALIQRDWVPQDERYLAPLSSWNAGNSDDPPSIPTSPPAAEPADQGPASYWVRFDPTPGGGGIPHSNPNAFSSFFELAQGLWSDLVIYRGASRQQATAADGNSTSRGAGPSWFRWLDQRISALRAGDVGRGALAIGRQFSWPAAVGGVLLALAVLGLMQLRLPAGWWRVGRGQTQPQATATEIPFYRQAVELLRGLGIRRRPAQTPCEFAQMAASQLNQPQLQPVLQQLTEAFYDTRFSGKVLPSQQAISQGDDEVQAALETLRQHVQASQRQRPAAPLPLPKKD